MKLRYIFMMALMSFGAYVSANDVVSNLCLWYDKPIPKSQGTNLWEEYSLPIGNGQLGASIMGDVSVDDIQFNEKTLSTGTPNDNGGDYGAYQNFGHVYIENLGDIVFSTYCRKLDLTQAIASVDYTSKKGKDHFSREYFVSNPDGVIAVSYETTSKKGISVRIRLVAGSDVPTAYVGNNATFSGSLQTIDYSARLTVDNEGGDVYAENGQYIVVKNARKLRIYVAALTNFDPHSPTFASGTVETLNRKASELCSRAVGKYAEISARHIADYQQLFNRCTLKLTDYVPQIPTDSLVNHCKTLASGSDEVLALEQLYYAYGRYLMIGSSRGVELPSNLQGIWNNTNQPAWNCDIHSNINVQMNYWPSEPTNLSELHLPYLYYIRNMALLHPQWQQYAREQGQTVGWTCYTENNIFGGVGGFMHEYTIANAWYSTHLWQHYRYTLDQNFLQTVALPVMESACRYWMQRMTKDSDGLFVCPNEYSPEQGPVENGTAHSQQLVSELFANTLDAIAVLPSACDKAFADSLKYYYDNTDRGLRTEIYDGQWGTDRIAIGTPILREWKYSPYSVGQHNHRHPSHLMCLYPFSQVTPADTLLFNAAIASLDLRGDESTGWSMGWKINLRARAHQGDRAEKILRRALHHSEQNGGVFYNLYDVHPPFQIDGNFGATAGMTEMLLQSYRGEIYLLPALPTSWRHGEIKGVKAEGGVALNLAWNDGRLQHVSLSCPASRQVILHYQGISNATISNAQIVEKSGDIVVVKLSPSEEATINF